MKISEVHSIVEKSTAKIIEASEVRADLLAVFYRSRRSSELAVHKFSVYHLITPM